MNKLFVGLFAVAAISVNAQDATNTSTVATTNTGLVGSLTTTTVVAGTVAAGVVAAVVANSDGASEPVPPVKTLKCEGTDPLVNDVCIRTTETVTVTRSGTGTGTKTITVPTTSTYAPTLQ